MLKSHALGPTRPHVTWVRCKWAMGQGLGSDLGKKAGGTSPSISDSPLYMQNPLLHFSKALRHV